MDLLICLVRTNCEDELLQLLRDYSGITTEVCELELPCQVGEVIADRQQAPTNYLINRNGDWFVIEINSLARLHELGARASLAFRGDFLQMLYVSVVDYAYFLFYRNGQQLREIEGRGDQELPDKDEGAWSPNNWDEPIRYFDLDTIKELAAGLGIDVSNLFTSANCLMLDSGTCPDLISLSDKSAIEAVLHGS